MKRREFIKSSLASAGAATAISMPAIARGKKYRWRMAMTIPKTLPIWGTGVQEFAKKVELISEGALKIRVYGAGELVPALGTFDAVKAGRLQMGHSASYYWQGKIPSAVFFTAVPFGLNANGMRAWLGYGGGQELWDELYAKHGLMAIPAGNTGMQMGGWFKKKIESINDFKGLKMRIPGLGGKVIAKAGAKPILVAGGEIYTSLATGVIDATEWVGPYHDYVMGFHKAAPYYYNPGWHEPGPVLELMINRKAWQELPAELQAVVRSCAAELDRDMYAEWIFQDAMHLKKIRSEGKVEVLSFPKPVLEVMKTYAAQAKDEVAATSPLAKKIYRSFQEFQDVFTAHQDVTERAYMGALQS